MVHQLSRKEFLRVAVGLVAATAVLEACSSTSAAGTGGDSGAAGACKADGAKDGGINDPLHHLAVPAADIVAGTTKTYSIMGTQTHDHMVTLAAADFAKLAQDQKVTVSSTTALGHTHTFDVVCA